MISRARLVHVPGRTTADAADLGGKATNLERLGAAGNTVPRWFAVTTDAFESALASAGIDDIIADRVSALGGAPDAARRLSEEVREAVLRMSLPSHIAGAIFETYEEIFAGGAHVAVRSSAVGEDAAGESFAGLHDLSLIHI